MPAGKLFQSFMVLFRQERAGIRSAPPKLRWPTNIPMDDMTIKYNCQVLMTAKFHSVQNRVNEQVASPSMLMCTVSELIKESISFHFTSVQHNAVNLREYISAVSEQCRFCEVTKQRTTSTALSYGQGDRNCTIN
jgi:hypothetical protein